MAGAVAGGPCVQAALALARRCALLLMVMLATVPAHAASVLFIATGNVPAGKFRVLAQVALTHA